MLVERWLVDAKVVDFLAARLPEEECLTEEERGKVLEVFPDVEWPSPAFIATGVSSKQIAAINVVIILFMGFFPAIAQDSVVNHYIVFRREWLSAVANG